MDNTQQVDPTALALSRAIRKAEGGDYSNYSGDNGTSAGAYQFNNGKIPLKKGEIPANFKSWASEVGLDPNDFSPTNQDHVAYEKIKRDLDSGLSQSQIAAKWNSGLTHGWENHVGDVTINGKVVHYDTPAYVNKVKSFYGQPPEDINSNTPKQDLTKDTIIQSQPTSQNTGILGTKKNDSLYGKLIDNSITRGIVKGADALTFGGVSQLGNEVGSSVAKLAEYDKGMRGQGNNSQYIPEPNAKEALKGGLKTVGSVALLGGGGLLKGLMSRTALQNPEIIKLLKIGKGETLETLPKTQAITRLKNALERLTVSEAGSKKEKLILKALEELNPTQTEKQGLLKKLLSGGVSLASKYALYKALGDKVGSIVHQNLPNK